MIEFWIAALALGLVAAALVIVPALRAWMKNEEGRSGATLGVAIVLALAIPVAAVILYSRWTTWDWSGNAARTAQEQVEQAHKMDEAINALLAKLEANPDDPQGWAMLGRSYMSMSRFADAAAAYQKALDAAGGEPVDLLADLGEAKALSDPQGLQGGAGAMFERVLELNPDYPKGLWYGGIYAYENQQFDLAADRLTRLLEFNPPESLVPLIKERIADAKAQQDVGDQTMAATEPAAQPAAETPVAEAPAAAASGAAIPIQITLDPNLAARVSRPAPLFIIAQNPAGGPPLAVIRKSSEQLPVSVELSDGNAMMQGVTIMDQPALHLVARVSLSGSPAAQPGDLYGEITYERGGGPVQIRIDQVVQ